MRITPTAVSLDVEDVGEDAGLNAVFLRRGIQLLPQDRRHDSPAGSSCAFVVEDLEGEQSRLRAEGVAITMPPTKEEWGERAFQVRDPNGVIVRLVDWSAR